MTATHDRDAADDAGANYATFRECLSEPVIRRLAVKPAKTAKRKAAKGRKNAIKPVMREESANGDTEGNDAEELGEFIDVRILSVKLSAHAQDSWSS